MFILFRIAATSLNCHETIAGGRCGGQQVTEAPHPEQADSASNRPATPKAGAGSADPSLTARKGCWYSRTCTIAKFIIIFLIVNAAFGVFAALANSVVAWVVFAFSVGLNICSVLPMLFQCGCLRNTATVEQSRVAVVQAHNDLLEGPRLWGWHKHASVGEAFLGFQGFQESSLFQIDISS